MKLRKNSWHYKMYEMVHGEIYNPPKNFCPYFWKGIVLGSILFPILFLFELPLIIGMHIRNKIEGWEMDSIEEEGMFSMNFGMALVLNFFLLIAFSMVRMWWHINWKNPHPFVFLGLIGWAILIVVGCIQLVKEIKVRKRSKPIVYISKEERPSILVEGIRSWYNKNCPIIEWDDEEKEK